MVEQLILSIKYVGVDNEHLTVEMSSKIHEIETDELVFNGAIMEVNLGGVISSK